MFSYCVLSGSFVLFFLLYILLFTDQKKRNRLVLPIKKEIGWCLRTRPLPSKELRLILLPTCGPGLICIVLITLIRL